MPGYVKPYMDFFHVFTKACKSFNHFFHSLIISEMDVPDARYVGRYIRLLHVPRAALPSPLDDDHLTFHLVHRPLLLPRRLCGDPWSEWESGVFPAELYRSPEYHRHGEFSCYPWHYTRFAYRMSRVRIRSGTKIVLWLDFIGLTHRPAEENKSLL